MKSPVFLVFLSFAFVFSFSFDSFDFALIAIAKLIVMFHTSKQTYKTTADSCSHFLSFSLSLNYIGMTLNLNALTFDNYIGNNTFYRSTKSKHSKSMRKHCCFLSRNFLIVYERFMVFDVSKMKREISILLILLDDAMWIIVRQINRKAVQSFFRCDFIMQAELHVN